MKGRSRQVPVASSGRRSPNQQVGAHTHTATELRRARQLVEVQEQAAALLNSPGFRAKQFAKKAFGKAKRAGRRILGKNKKEL